VSACTNFPGKYFRKFLAREKIFSGFYFFAGKVFPDFIFQPKTFFRNTIVAGILALTENPENIFFHACEKIRKKIQKKSYSNSR